jgi:hypothetical protein
MITYMFKFLVRAALPAGIAVATLAPTHVLHAIQPACIQTVANGGGPLGGGWYCSWEVADLDCCIGGQCCWTIMSTGWCCNSSPDSCVTWQNQETGCMFG